MQERYEDRLTGGMYQEEFTATEKPAPIGDGECVYVNIINPDTNADESANNVEFYYGDQNVQRHKMLTATETGRLPIKRLDKIWVRTKTGQTVRGVIEVYK